MPFDEWPPEHEDLDKVRHRARRQNGQIVREYSRNRKGVYGRGSHMYTGGSVGGSDAESMIRAGLIMLTIGTCGFGLPVWLGWEIINYIAKD